MSQTTKTATHRSFDSVSGDERQTAEDTITIHIRARDVKDIGSGNYVVQLDARPLTPAEQDTLIDLFPTLFAKAWTLLESEALLQAVTPSPRK